MLPGFVWAEPKEENGRRFIAGFACLGRKTKERIRKNMEEVINKITKGFS